MRRLPDDEALKRIVYGDYIKGSKRRGHEFSLTREQFDSMIFEDCFYCGREPSNRLAGRNGDRFRHHQGIDRIDNQTGYVIGNVVPCCRWCNEAKRAKSFTDFVQWLEGLSRNLEKIRDCSS